MQGICYVKGDPSDPEEWYSEWCVELDGKQVHIGVSHRPVSPGRNYAEILGPCNNRCKPKQENLPDWVPSSLRIPK
jgi:hypothetical protein